MEKKKDYAFEFSDYQLHRQKFVPGCPQSLVDPVSNKVTLDKQPIPISDSLKEIFPVLFAKEMPYYELKLNEGGVSLGREHPLRIGLVLSGGQAAGGHNVIMGVYDMAKLLHKDSKVFGFLMGPKGIYTNKYVEIDANFMQLYRNMGGFDMICSGRDKIETPEQFENSLKNCTTLDLDGLVVIGGDDSNTNACLLSEYFEKSNSKCKVIGCPKTIDGDLKNEHIEVSFGFDTATKTFSEAIGNLCMDALSSKMYYYFVRLMGRSASSIALECALNTRINSVIIAEEVEQKKMTLSQITNYLADIICKRDSLGKNYGVFLLPEGLVEFVPEIKSLISQINELLSKPFEGDIREYVSKHLSFESKAVFTLLPMQISDQLLLDRDPHGNVQVSKIETEKLLILLLMNELENRVKDGKYKGPFKSQSHFFGYEGRCALPSNLDSQYCYSLGRNATVLIHHQVTGYMSCVKNLADPNPANWVAAGCPLINMMHLERRKGKDLPVIKKALVELDGAMFKSYEAVRDKWAVLDCYWAPGPIQFEGAYSRAINFLIQPPNQAMLVRETEEHEAYEMAMLQKGHKAGIKSEVQLSVLGRERVAERCVIPDTLESKNFVATGIKKYKPFSQLVSHKIQEQFTHLSKEAKAHYFVEIQDRLLAKFQHNIRRTGDSTLDNLNKEFYNYQMDRQLTIGVLQLGAQTSGGNNVIDGLLRFQEQRKGHVRILGFVNGMRGFQNEEVLEVTEEAFWLFRNSGGYDFLGKSSDAMRSPEQLSQALHVCQKLQLSGLVVMGATHTLTDAAILADYLIAHNCGTRVVAIPSTVDGNIHHSYVGTALGFDTASKVYSQLVGNMLTDSASAIKYWYFIRLMGRDPSHLALECALRTHPNIVIISEESMQRNESLMDIVNRICDVIADRAEQSKNYGCVLIPEGLLGHISAYNSLLEELSTLFSSVKDRNEALELSNKFYSNDALIKDKLTPWSYSLYITIPDFIKKQILFEREVQGSVRLAQIETEKFMAYLVENELARRKKEGKYKGSFAPVTHYFGYQGRCAFPSKFDCSLGSTYGFTAGVLVENGLTGVSVTAQDITAAPGKWRVGAIPLLALLRSQPKSGYRRADLVVPSEEVDLYGDTYQKMKAIERGWRLVDHYSNPGPIQFQGYGSDDVALTLKYMYNQRSHISEQIKAICSSIQNDCLFVEHQHLLIAALSSLESAKSVINSMTNESSLGANVD